MCTYKLQNIYCLKVINLENISEIYKEIIPNSAIVATFAVTLEKGAPALTVEFMKISMEVK